MARIRIDIDHLTTALSDHENEWVLDLETGEVLMNEWIRDPKLRGDMGMVLDEPLEDDDEEDFDPLDSDRFRGIQPVASHTGFRWMECFAQDQQDGRVRDRLHGALDRPRPFRRFRDALEEFPAVRDSWFRYEEDRLREEAESWLRAEKIDAQLVGTHLPGAPGGEDR